MNNTRGILLSSTILAIGAHPDDIELGCAGTLLKHKNEGANIYLLVLTYGEASGDSIIRKQECLSSANLLEANNIYFGNLIDTQISDGIETIIKIEKIISEINPDVIYTHTYKDTHQDHRNTAYATLSAGRRCRKILMYESPTTFRDFTPQLFVDIESVFEKKLEIIKNFSSQSNKTWWSTGRRAALAVEGLAYYRGFQSGVGIAEAFEVGRLVITSLENFMM
jgi:LmbE family N-acetylglucosaminyl deacetylase